MSNRLITATTTIAAKQHFGNHLNTGKKNKTEKQINNPVINACNGVSEPTLSETAVLEKLPAPTNPLNIDVNIFAAPNAINSMYDEAYETAKTDKNAQEISKLEELTPETVRRWLS